MKLTWNKPTKNKHIVTIYRLSEYVRNFYGTYLSIQCDGIFERGILWKPSFNNIKSIVSWMYWVSTNSNSLIILYDLQLLE